LILDLHVHSLYSFDSPVTPAEYAARVVELRRDYAVDGFVLMEHNQMVGPERCDLAAIARAHEVVILAGIEVDTYWGHLLVYGITRERWAQIEARGKRKQEPKALAAELAAAGGMAMVPSHPFRYPIGLREHCLNLPGIRAIEGLNGDNDPAENDAALHFARQHGLATTGGSDAHFVAQLGSALTRFPGPVRTMAELVDALHAGRFEAITLEQARKR
jgi:predicted metal-dependent phosphoesterase TrpH